MLPAGPALVASLRSDERDRLIRAAVVDEALADALADRAIGLLSGSVDDRALALAVARALSARRVIPPLLDRVDARPEDWIGVHDPLHPEQTLAQGALRFAIDAVGVRRPRVRRGALDALAHGELRALAWRALGDEEPDAVLPHLTDLLTDAPELAPEVATRFALVHTERCQEAARAVAPLPESTRRAFADALSKHLRRIFAIRRWVECRDILFGR